MIRLLGLQPTYMPNDVLEFEYTVSNIDRSTIAAVEVSVIWLTEGKGSEDMGVHFFQRVSGNSLAAIEWSKPQRLNVPLPESPLSYEGKILTISWCVRVRFYLSDGTELVAQEPFYLGTITKAV
ncbi:hypothetical protein SH501x_002035 [Pirellulaceae bacterium SH501]|jgi:hypothetical protein|nr:arrestin family protein [Pirellula sp.]